MDERTKILVVDDDRHILQILKLYLQKDGYEVATCERGDLALDEIERVSPKLILLDVMLPGKDGWEILKELREKSAVPVIMLTAKGDITDRVQGLDCGADDYIVKPFEGKEVLARVKAVLRRTAMNPDEIKVVTVGSLEISLDNYSVMNCGKPVDMPPKEIELLYYLATHPGRVFTREQILDSVWGFGFYGDSRTVDVHIKRLRDRFGERSDWRIETVWGVGYKFMVNKE